MTKISLAAAIALAYPIATIANAQDAAAAASITTDTAAQTVVVSASRGTRLDNMDISTTVLTRDQIEAAPEPTLDQILNKIPGVVIPTQPSMQLHPTGQVLSIRGFGTSTNGLTLVLLDGVPINDPYFRTVNWAQIPKDSIERIEVIRGGGATSLWGNMAMGGVINIVSRSPADGEKSVSVSGGNHGTHALDANLGFHLADHLSLGLNVDTTDSKGYDPTPLIYRNPAMSATTSHVADVGAVVNYDPMPGSHYFARLQASRTQEDGLTYALANNTWDTYRLTAGAETRPWAGAHLGLSGWYQDSSMETQNVANASYTLATPTAGTPYISQQERASYHSLGASGYLGIDSDWLRDLKIGADWRKTAVDDPLQLFNASSALGNIASFATHRFEGLFAQGTYRPGAIPLDITLGLREDFWQASDAGTRGQYQGSAIDTTLPGRSFDHFDPRLGAKLAIGGGWDVRAAAYRNFSAPGLNQMYRSFASGGNYTVPNTDLRPQTNQGYEAGLDYHRDSVNLAATVYSNRVSDYIDYTTVQTGCAAANNYCGTGVSAATSLRQYVNAGTATLRGFELLGDWRVIDGLTLTGGFTRTSAFLTSSTIASDPTHRQLGQIPRWIATAGAQWQVAQALQLSLQLKSFGQYWNNTAHSQINQAATLADLGVDYRLSQIFTLFGSAQNIGNRRYYDQGLGYNADGSVNTSASGSIPALGQPFSFLVGARANF